MRKPPERNDRSKITIGANVEDPALLQLLVETLAECNPGFTNSYKKVQRGWRSIKTSTIQTRMVKGKLIDDQTRCVHWHSSLDIIAIKFKCCDTYYPCFECHQETVDHRPQIWTKDERDEKAILCGECKTELTIREYFDSANSCPHCKSAFNPNCSRHYHLYFEV